MSSFPRPHLPDNWVALRDPMTNKYFYLNVSSGLTQWNFPHHEIELESSPLPPPNHLPDNWVAMWDTKAGTQYYRNLSSGFTQSNFPNQEITSEDKRDKREVDVTEDESVADESSNKENLQPKQNPSSHNTKKKAKQKVGSDSIPPSSINPLTTSHTSKKDKTKTNKSPPESYDGPTHRINKPGYYLHGFQGIKKNGGWFVTEVNGYTISLRMKDDLVDGDLEPIKEEEDV